MYGGISYILRAASGSRDPRLKIPWQYIHSFALKGMLRN